MRILKAFLFPVILLFLVTIHGCSSSSGSTPSAVTLQRVNNLYYKVDINMQASSHYDIGRQYASRIKDSAPDFESQIDSGLKKTIEVLVVIDFDTLVKRAQTIFTNIPSEYQDEIRGMQSVFSDTDDKLGNGRLSQNKLLVYQLVPDVARLTMCSASAAFGNGTESGKTILGRNLEWLDTTLPFLSTLQTVATLHNGDKSIVMFGFLGQLYVISGFNESIVFVSILDSAIPWPYPNPVPEGKRSYVMDLRYALENQTSLQGIADYLKDKDYAFDFNIFLADKESAAVLEKDNNPDKKHFSGLRTATSTLKTDTKVKILPWNFSNAIACVNWFTLPGTTDNSDFWEGNAPRWSSYIDLYGKYLSQGKITIDVMKLITGYPGPGPSGYGKAENGAIWRYEDGESEIQSIIMNMETLETWISFQPPGKAALLSPNYIQVFSGNPF